MTLVRLVFALLALAGGAGILLYLALWAYSRSARSWWWVALLIVVAGALLLRAVGVSDRSVAGIALVAGGLTLAWRRGVGFQADAPLSYGGLARIRSEERSEVAARVHDSVLQTLALIQRHAQEPRRVAAIARRQERELRGWLYGEQPLGDETASLVAALSSAAADVEELHGVRVELASAGDSPVDGPAQSLVLAVREAMANAAKFAGVEEIDVYLEVTDDAISVFVRDRGVGFDRAKVPAGRRGLVESIERRLERAGGNATVVTSPGAGTEVELRLPRRVA